jgi:hypothetical protein
MSKETAGDGHSIERVGNKYFSYNDATKVSPAVNKCILPPIFEWISGEAPIKITVKGLSHVLERHTINGAKSLGRSVFSEGKNIEELIKASEKVQPIQQGSGNLERVVDAGRTVGIDRNTGAPTSIYTVITDIKTLLSNC